MNERVLPATDFVKAGPLPPLPNVFSGRLLDGATHPPLRDNSAASLWILQQSLGDLNGRPITAPSEADDDLLSDMMTAETIYALNRKEAPTSTNWYTKAIARMIAVCAVLHPEIGSDEAAASHPSRLFKDRSEARTVLFAAMAITSQNIQVLDNMRYALEQYREFLQHGQFNPNPYGANGFAIESNLARFNFILERANGDLGRVRRLLSMKMKMSDLQKMAKRFGINIAGKELSDETVYGSMLFGPKVGNGFYQNLIGNHSPVTIDLWFMRLWGRYTGTLVREEITGEAQSRLVKGLRRSLRGARMKSLMEEAGVAVDPSKIWDMDAQELLVYTRKLRRFWESLRKKFVSGTMSESFADRDSKKALKNVQGNSQASELKSRLLWPGAAESIVKSLGMPVDMPKSASLRRWIRSVCAKSLDKLKDSGYRMTAADMQAVLWYPEKEIYGRLTGRPAERLNMSYDEAIVRLALSEGLQHDAIQAALQSVEPDGSRGPSGSEGAGRSEREPDEWFGGRSVETGGQTGFGREGIELNEQESSRGPPFHS